MHEPPDAPGIDLDRVAALPPRPARAEGAVPRRSLFRRLLITFLAVLATYGALTQLLAYRLGAEVLSDAFERELGESMLAALEESAAPMLAAGADPAALQRLLDERYGSFRRVSLAVYGPDGIGLASRAAEPNRVPAKLPAKLRAEVAERSVRRAQGLGFSVVGPVHGRADTPLGYVYLAAQPDPTSTLRLLGEASWRWGLPVFLLAVVAAYLGTRSVTQRLRIAEEAVSRMAKGDLTARIPVEANDEIGKVAITFNRTADLLERTVRELSTTDANRRRLVADFAHELNTPLTNVLAYLESLQLAEADGSMDAETRRSFIEVAYDEARRLAHLARDLETLTKLEAGRLTMEQELVDLGAVAEGLARRIAPRAEAQGLAVHTDITPGGEIVGDRMRLEQVGMNLLENALRYTTAGSVTLAVVPDDDGVGFEVRDTGVGIPEADLPRVTERFYRVDSSRTRSTGGSGLGLAIVGGIVDRHGGSVTIRSEVGRGTTVRLHFPREGTISDRAGPVDR